MSNATGALLGSILRKSILVAAVLLAMKLVAEGLYVAGTGIVLSLAVLAYLSLTDAWLLR